MLSQGMDFTRERRGAHVVGFRLPPLTSLVVQRTRATLPRTMDSSEE